jgi:hypothetical protein
VTLTTDGRIRVPADLEGVPDRGAEDPGGLSPAALERLWDSVRHGYAAGMQPAIQLCLRRNGRVVLNRAIGHAWGNGPSDPPDAEQIPVTVGTPYCVTVDFETLEGKENPLDTVTLRHRDTGEQERVAIADLAAKLRA